nr:MAG TPA: hypothetical protein [Caudoviricetes sp.]
MIKPCIFTRDFYISFLVLYHFLLWANKELMITICQEL